MFGRYRTKTTFGVCFTGWGPDQDVQLAAISWAGFKIVRSDAPDLAASTAIADACHVYGLQWLPIVRDARLVSLAGHPGIAGFEVWNEPNLIQPLPRDEWVTLIRSVNQAGCKPTISGGVADNQDYVGWVAAVRPLPADVKLGVHPYVFANSAVKEAHTTDRSRRIWVTEFGAGKVNITEAKRASYLSSQLKSMAKYAVVLIVYSWDDAAWSIANPDGSLLPSGAAISKLIAKLR
jgi:hypothetical protein